MELDDYWESIPLGKEAAVGYAYLTRRWGMDARRVRAVLHELSKHDAGDGLVLIRSARDGGGFYRTADPGEMRAYRSECLRKGRSLFAALRRIDAALRDAGEEPDLVDLGALTARQEGAE